MKILLVDDHALFREGAALLLASVDADVQVLQAGTCDAALDVIAREDGIDVVLMDLQLPGVSGVDAIRAVRSRYPDLAVVALSSTEDKATVMQVLEAGAMGFVPKSSTSAVLKDALKLIMDKGVYLPASAFLGSPAPAVTARTAASLAGSGITPASLGLTPRQSDVLLRILQGKPAKLISRELGVSSSTVKVHTTAVLRALNVTTRTQAVIAAGKLGLRFPEDERRSRA
ncbi:MAG TPA: response regulator transcription factor [Casimicrobiaceae bacterium]|nr:response regulator transcription factor [Casimicrobiaceae bacterium]